MLIILLIFRDDLNKMHNVSGIRLPCVIMFNSDIWMDDQAIRIDTDGSVHEVETAQYFKVEAKAVSDE